ncbi:MAG: hypothetical protein ABIJ48_12020 [Actinomycetota bacterium]
MRTRKTLMAVLTTAALIGALGAPAAWGRPGKPIDPPVLVDVTMTLAGAEGMTTDCDDRDGIDGSMVMERTADGTLFPVFSPILGLNLEEVDSSRLYPEAVSSIGFTGCHGGNLDGTEPKYGGLAITVDATGAVTSVLWHFDYYVLETVVRKRTVVQVLEHFTLSGQDLQWDAATSTASGWFQVAYHLEDKTTGESVDYVPVAGSPRYLSFTFTMEPHV